MTEINCGVPSCGSGSFVNTEQKYLNWALNLKIQRTENMTACGRVILPNSSYNALPSLTNEMTMQLMCALKHMNQSSAFFQHHNDQAKQHNYTGG